MDGLENITPEEQDFLDSLRGSESTDPEPTNTDPAPEDTTSTESHEGEDSSTGEGEGGGQEPSLEDILNGNGKNANQAFAEMRVRNRQLEQTLSGVASALGIDPKSSSEEVLAGINAVLTQNQAKQQNIPLEVLQRLNDLEAANAAHMSEQMRAHAVSGLTAVKDKFNVSLDDMTAFVAELNEAGLNPNYNPNVNLEAEYLMRHWDKVVEQKVNAAVAAEQERAAHANEHSSTPNNTSGSTKQEQRTTINTVKDLDAFFSDVKI